MRPSIVTASVLAIIAAAITCGQAAPASADRPSAPRKIVLYSNGTGDADHPDGCSMFNGPPRTLKTAAAAAGYELKRLCQDWQGDGGERGSYIHHRAGQFEAEVARYVAEGVRRENIVLAGHSAGAWSALMALSRRPGLARSAILFAPACCGREHGPDEPKWKRTQQRQEGEITSARSIKALVFAYEGDKYNEPDELRFLTARYPRSVRLIGYKCGWWGHATHRFDCRFSATIAEIADYLR